MLTKQHFQELLAELLSGVEWVLTDGTKPIARLVPVSTRVPGLHAGMIRTSDDFDQPLSEEFWMGDK